MTTTTKTNGKPHDMHHVARMIRRVLWCDRYIPALELIASDKDVDDWCKTGYWTKEPSPHAVARDFVYGQFFHEAYECGMVPTNYREDVETIMPHDEVVPHITDPSPEFLEPLTSRQVLACIGFHFRADYFSNGSLLEESVPNGSLLTLMTAYREKALAEIASYEDDVIEKALMRAYKKEIAPKKDS